MEDIDTFDDYFYKGTTILKNKFGITDQDELKTSEQRSVLTKLTVLRLFPIMEACDYNNLKRIHKYLFDDVYFFAGEQRTCTLSKNGYNFVDPSEIEEDITKTIDHYSKKIDDVAGKDELAFVLGPFYYDLIRVHPFREGNGRSIREFIKETVEMKFDNIELDYSKIDKEAFFRGVQHRYFFPSMLEVEFMKGLTYKEDKKTK